MVFKFLSLVFDVEITERFEKIPEMLVSGILGKILLSHPHTRRDSKGGCNGRKYGDEDVQDFTPK